MISKGFLKMKNLINMEAGPIYKNLNNNNLTEWALRIFISGVFIQNLIVEQDEYYPDYAWALLFVALQLYFFKLRLMACIPLIMALFIHFFHNS